MSNRVAFPFIVLCLLLLGATPASSEETRIHEWFGGDCVEVPALRPGVVPTTIFCQVFEDSNPFPNDEPQDGRGFRYFEECSPDLVSGSSVYPSPSGALTVVLFEFTGECDAQLPTPESHFFEDVE